MKQSIHGHVALKDGTEIDLNGGKPHLHIDATQIKSPGKDSYLFVVTDNGGMGANVDSPEEIAEILN